MTERHLKIILMECGLSIDEFAISRLYAPEYVTHKMTKQHFLNLNKKTLCFDWLQNDFEFIEGTVNASGIEIIFNNPWFHKIKVYPLYEYRTSRIYNQVLAIPEYTAKDREGKSKICQTSHKIRSQKDLDRYFKKLFQKFECPLISNDSTN